MNEELYFPPIWDLAAIFWLKLCDQNKNVFMNIFQYAIVYLYPKYGSDKVLYTKIILPSWIENSRVY